MPRGFLVDLQKGRGGMLGVVADLGAGLTRDLPVSALEHDAVGAVVGQSEMETLATARS